MHQADILKFARRVFSEGNIFDEIYVLKLFHFYIELNVSCNMNHILRRVIIHFIRSSEFCNF